MEKIWLKNYPEGVNKSVNLNEYKSFADFLDKGFSEFNEYINYKIIAHTLFLVNLERYFFIKLIYIISF